MECFTDVDCTFVGGRGPSDAFQYFWIPTHWLSE